MTKQHQVIKLFNKKHIIKQKDKNGQIFKFVARSTYSKIIFLISFFLKKWYQEKYCSCQFFLIMTTIIFFLALQLQ